MEKEIYRLTRGDLTLTHSWYADDMGFRRNSFDMFDEKTRTHYPFHGMIRVSNYERNTPIGGDDISPYTEAEYAEMFDEQVTKIATPLPPIE